MIEIYHAAEEIKPQDVHCFVDKAHVWLRRKLTPDERSHLAQQCGVGGLHINNRRARWDRSYRQLIQLHQPNAEAFRWLAQRNDVHLNYIEFVLDWIFYTAWECDEAYEFACAHHVKKHHRRQQVRFAGEGGVTRYTGHRGAPNNFVAYKDRPSKATGEVHCVHFEWRVRGAAALRRMGIAGPADVLTLDARYFWLNRLLFYGVPSAELGMRYANSRNGWYRRRPLVRKVGSITYPFDARLGGTLKRACGSTQALVDQLGSKLDINRLLVAIRTSHLLPTQGHTLL